MELTYDMLDGIRHGLVKTRIQHALWDGRTCGLFEKKIRHALGVGLITERINGRRTYYDLTEKGERFMEHCALTIRLFYGDGSGR